MPSPAADPTPRLGNTADDFSYNTLDRHNVYVGWADWRPGEGSAFFGFVKLLAFNYSQQSQARRELDTAVVRAVGGRPSQDAAGPCTARVASANYGQT